MLVDDDIEIVESFVIGESLVIDSELDVVGGE